MTYRNRKLLDLAHGQPCMHCGAEDGTVVAAHSNASEHGKGLGIKAHDGMIAFLCHRCHFELDQGNTLERAAKRELFMRALARTYMRLWDLGLIKVA